MIDKGLIEMDGTLHLTKLRKKIRNFDRTAVYNSAGMATRARVLIHYLQTGMVTPYLPSAVLTMILWIMGVQIFVFGLIADMLKTQRQIGDEVQYRLKKMKFENSKW